MLQNARRLYIVYIYIYYTKTCFYCKGLLLQLHQLYYFNYIIIIHLLSSLGFKYFIKLIDRHPFSYCTLY